MSSDMLFSINLPTRVLTLKIILEVVSLNFIECIHISSMMNVYYYQ